jgi:cytochrome P450/NADPH-cytochrome P450 reductase
MATQQTLQTTQQSSLAQFLKSNKAFKAEIVSNNELLHNDLSRSTRHVEVQLPAGINYKAGDHLGICPANPESVVNSYLKLTNMAPDSVIQVRLLDGQNPNQHQGLLPLNKPMSAFGALSFFYELQQPVSLTQLHQLTEMLSAEEGAEAELERNRLVRLTETSNKIDTNDEYATFVTNRRLTLVELLASFPCASRKVHFAKLLALLPPMKPRYYSISSSPLGPQGASVASISVSVVKGPSPTGRIHQGVASNYLRSFSDNFHRVLPFSSTKQMPLWAFVKDTGSSFRLPIDQAKPVIMVGPGTGVAPMRGFIQQRAAERAYNSTQRPCGENILFFGCRDDCDFIYRNEFEKMAKDGVLDKLCVAYSRKENQGVPKTYVQQDILGQTDLLLGLLKRGAYIYVCGDASQMAPAVKATFVSILAAGGDENPEETIVQMYEDGRYCEDVWAAQGRF